MINFLYHQESENVFEYFWQLQFVLSGFAQHLASHFGRSRTSMCFSAPGLLSNGRSLSQHSYRYAFSNDRPNCFASYSAQPDP